MKKLYLVRHAKSSWRHDGLSDMDRPLKGSGIRDAYNTSEWLRQEGERPQKIFSSPATRALHTALIFSKQLQLTFDNLEIREEIYMASNKAMFEFVKGLNDDWDSVMIFGHNPTLTDFVNKCIDHRIDNVPTTGVACLNFESKNWSSIDKKADLLFFDYPKRRNK